MLGVTGIVSCLFASGPKSKFLENTHMSAELYIEFKNQDIRKKYLPKLKEKIISMPTYVQDEQSEEEKKVYVRRYDEFWLKGIEPYKGKKERDYDVRIFTGGGENLKNFIDMYPVIEISAHPKSIEEDLQNLFAYLRSETEIRIFDEDGEVSGW